MNTPPRLAIFDGHGIIHRAYYALKDQPLVARRTGENTSGVFGFTNTLLAVIDDLKPTHLIVAMDLPGPTFRHIRDATYKASRFENFKTSVQSALAAVPDLADSLRQDIAVAVASAERRDEIKEKLYASAAQAGIDADTKLELERALGPFEVQWDIGHQIGRCLEMMDAFNIPVYSAQGFEADDVIGTLSRQAAAAGIETYLITLDSDLVQLIEPNVTIYMMRPYQRDHVLYDEAAARERYGFDPLRMPDFKALRGDSSDNIPGIPGVGDGTATKLLASYGSIDGIYEHLPEVKPDKVRGLLEQYRDQVYHAREMATIETQVPDIILDMEEARVGRYDRQRVLDLLRDLEFRTLVPRLPPVEEGFTQSPQLALEGAPSGGQQIEKSYTIVNTEAALDALVERIRAAKRFAFDIEGVGTNPYHCLLVGIAIATAPGVAAYIPVGHQTQPGLAMDGGNTAQLSAGLVIQRLESVFTDPEIEKVAHNGKFDVAYLAAGDRYVHGFAFDTLLAAYILGEGALGDVFRVGSGSLSLKWLTSRRLGFEMREVVDLVGKTGVKQQGVDQVRIEDLLPYACENVDYTLRLREPLEKELRDLNMWELFSGMEMPLVPVLARMEAEGIALDVGVLREMSQGINEQITYLESQAYSSVGHEFNMGSPPQLSTVLFDELKLPHTRRTKQGYSTDAQAIEGLRGVHPIVDTLLRWRELTKLRSTYIEALPGAVDPRDGRIHTTFEQAVAATGRLSSTNPNLQNIPVRSELGGQVRRAFVARDIGENPHLLSADYSQIELRILAHVSQDPGLLEAFRNDEDIHAATASQVFGVPIEEVTRPMRNRAKVFNFGVLYGLTDFGLAQREGISREEAGAFIKRYFEKYASVKAWRDDIVQMTRRDGYAETLAGRRRYIPDIHSSNFNVRMGAERIAINMPIQGTASDIIKIAMIRLDKALEDQGMQTKMLLQVHDELIFEGPQSELDALRALVLEIMPASLQLDVPLKVDVKVGRNWADME
ncbi:MAG TPA: DNA polymerase I [Dehalococcoidia bacterium]|nr:DNA polymerase I [Dehalococcoidia bacterium]